jgi:3D-(3,5/4)-trihydroxycyclohexane-1,2-dione acylhydrolase (decyclizing)
MRTLTDPANCGPVTLACYQDVQAESFEYPKGFFKPKVWRIRRPEPDKVEVEEVVKVIKAARKPVIVSGGGVLYSGADDLLADLHALVTTSRSSRPRPARALSPGSTK